MQKKQKLQSNQKQQNKKDVSDLPGGEAWLPKYELENCSFVKAILMVLVVLYHSCVFWRENWFDGIKVATHCQTLGAFAQWLNSFHVYGFILVSGYVFAYLKYEKSRYSDFNRFLRNKAKRLIVPYWGVALLWVIPISCPIFHYDLNEVVRRYIFGIDPNQLWFLLMLFWCFMIAYLLSNVLRNDLAAIFIGAAAAVIGITGNQVLPDFYQIWSGCSYFPFFILGMKLRQGSWRLFRRVPILIYVLLDAVLFLTWYSIDRGGSPIMRLAGIMLGYAVHATGALLAFFVFQDLGRRVRWKEQRTLKALIDNQMTIYLLHQQIIWGCILVLNGNVHPVLHAGLNFMISLLLSYMIGSFLLRNRFTRILVGGSKS